MIDESILRPYQKRISDTIVNDECAGVFLDPGLGKTLTVLHAIERLPEYTVFLFAPIRVVETVWRQEAKQFGIDINFSLVRGTPKERTAALQKKAQVYLINFEGLVWLLQSKWRKPGKLMLVIDESTFLKSPKTSRWKVLRKNIKFFHKRVILTGTPIPNTYGDLWTQMGILDMGKRLETSYSRFQNLYFVSDYMGFKWSLKPDAESTINSKIEDIVYRVDAADYLELPEVIEVETKIFLDKEEKATYDRLEKDSIMKLDEQSITALSAAALHGKLSQLSNGFIYDAEGGAKDLHSRKWDAIKEIYEELNGKTLLLVYKFRHEITKFKEMFGDDVTVINEHKAEKVVDDWNNGLIPILAIHPKSAGHGLNLQRGGSYILMTCPVYSGEDYIQIIKRLARPGGSSSVIVNTLKTQGTVDESIQNSLTRKLNSQESFLSYFKEKKHI